MPIKSSDSVEREIIYKSIQTAKYTGLKAITCDRAEELLGWHEVQEGDKEEFLLKDGKKKIRCSNNIKNRPLTSSHVSLLSQEILRGRWKVNGETIKIGKTGLVLDGQHTLIALVLACREHEENPDSYPEWMDEEPTLEKFVMFGIDEDDETVNTMDTCKPRSLSDVLYRSEFFKDKKASERKKLAGVCDHAVRMLWDRTGVPEAFSIQRTHAESLAFLEAHKSLLQCLSFITEEEAGREKRISRYLTLGYCSALMYLMSCSTSSDEYLQSWDRNEDSLDFENLDKAEEFFVLLSSSEQGAIIRRVLGNLIEDGDSSRKATTAVLVKAWDCFAQGQKITASKLKLDYYTDSEGTRTLIETPTVGGIDVGARSTQISTDPTQEEMEETKKQIQSEKS